ncbi:TPA: hypothetical protein PD213_002814, partial [Staphylococcus aureus]|nr:oligoendopeptidase F family protein [Staphylococcus aureus]HDE8388534.1 hypothetical protein [Staphylococcus aureus]
YDLNVKSLDWQNRNYKIERLYNRLEKKYEFFNEAISKHKTELLNLISNNKELKKYKYYYNNFFEKEKRNYFKELYEEANIKEQYNNILYFKEYIGEFEVDNEKYMVTSNTLLTYLNSENRKIRKNAYEAVINFFSKKEVEAAFLVNLNYLIKNKMANANGFDTYFEEVIENHFISINNPSFFEVSHNVKKIFKKSLDIRRQILGLEKISHFDMYYFGEHKSHISYKEAQKIIKEALKHFGEEYLGILDKIFKENWIHHESSSLKKFGGRSYSSINTHPYIIINWNNDIDSLFALIHEIGGAVSQYLAQNSCSIVYSELSEAKVEFMSVLNEYMLSKYLLENNVKEIDRNEAFIRVLEFLKDDFFVPYEYMNLLYSFSQNSTKFPLTHEIIDEEYDKVIKDFRDFKHFENINLNKKNWIKAHDQLSIEYNLNYICAFILVLNFDINKFNKVINLCKQGEIQSDGDFFYEIFESQLDFINLNKNAIKWINNLIDSYMK